MSILAWEQNDIFTKITFSYECIRFGQSRSRTIFTIYDTHTHVCVCMPEGISDNNVFRQ